MGPKTKIYTLGDKALKLSLFDSSRKNKQSEKKCLNRMKNNQVMLIMRSRSIVAVCLFLAKTAILATFFKISTSNLFCPSFTLRLISKPN